MTFVGIPSSTPPPPPTTTTHHHQASQTALATLTVQSFASNKLGERKSRCSSGGLKVCR